MEKKDPKAGDIWVSFEKSFVSELRDLSAAIGSWLSDSRFDDCLSEMNAACLALAVYQRESGQFPDWPTTFIPRAPFNQRRYDVAKRSDPGWTSGEGARGNNDDGEEENTSLVSKMHDKQVAFAVDPQRLTGVYQTPQAITSTTWPELFGCGRFLKRTPAASMPRSLNGTYREQRRRSVKGVRF